MLIIGLTGSIGMGKSAAAQQFLTRGVPVFDADAEVHRLYDGPLALEIDTAFPGTRRPGGGVDRAKLSAALMREPQRFAELNQIVHPHVRASERAFLHMQHAKGAAIAVLEIPLLLETGADAMVDVVVVVSAPADVQRRRVLDRPGMTAAKLDAILARQLPDAEKRKRAHFVVDTSGPVAQCHSQIDAILAKQQGRAGTAFERVWRI